MEGLPSGSANLVSGQVAEWLMAAGCKPATPCELRRFESSPVHHLNCVRTGTPPGLSSTLSVWLRYSSVERADVAQLVERVLGKDEVTSSTLVIGSRI